MQECDGKDAERVLRTTFVAAWADRPIGDITALDVLEIINAKKRRAPQQARALMVLIRRFFNWACDAHVYGLTASPCDRLSVSRIIGPVPKRNRSLNDAEIFAFWRATERMKYPVGPAYKLLLLTGLRLNEAAQLSWPEVQGDTIVIPPDDEMRIPLRLACQLGGDGCARADRARSIGRSARTNYHRPRRCACSTARKGEASAGAVSRAGRGG